MYRIVTVKTKSKNVLKKVRNVLKYKTHIMSEYIDTRKTRIRLGFPEDVKSWVESPALYDEHSLRINGHPVMEDWEVSYMQKLAEIATKYPGQILEIGYGMGLSARAIQDRHPETHWIIECNRDVLKKARTDLNGLVDSGKVRLLEGFWQDVTSSLPDSSFDGILFDTYPLKEEEIHSNHFWFFEEAHRLLKPGGILTYYSDEVDSISTQHLAKLEAAGFNPANISFQTCNVNPPPDCEYWQHKTIVAPIVKK